MPHADIGEETCAKHCRKSVGASTSGGKGQKKWPMVVANKLGAELTLEDSFRNTVLLAFEKETPVLMHFVSVRKQGCIATNEHKSWLARFSSKN